MKNGLKHWTSEDCQRAAQIVLAMAPHGMTKGKIAGKIARALGRTPSAILEKWNRFGPTFGTGKIEGAPNKHGIVPPRVLREQDHRANLAPRDLTAQILGDPLPGYSALDMKRGVVPFARRA